MRVEFDDFSIYNIDLDYLKYMHDLDSEVYYAEGYERKPFLGIVVGIGRFQYFIPFTSAKKKHLKWSDVGPDHFLIVETVKKESLPSNAIFRPLKDDMAEHILAALDIKKMIPVPSGLYTKVDMNDAQNPGYRTLLDKEFSFCKKNRRGILYRIAKIYKEQKSTKRVHDFYCDFSKLEKGCRQYQKAGR